MFHIVLTKTRICSKDYKRSSLVSGQLPENKLTGKKKNSIFEAEYIAILSIVLFSSMKRIIF